MYDNLWENNPNLQGMHKYISIDMLQGSKREEQCAGF